MGRKHKHANKNKSAPPAANSKQKQPDDDERLQPAPEDENLDVDFQHYSSEDDAANNGDTADANASASNRKRQRGNASSKADDMHDDDDDDDNSDDSDDDEDGEDVEAAEIQLKDAALGESDVEVTLDFYDPCEADSRALITFFERWVHRVGAGDSTTIAGLVAAQTRVGTTVRVDENESPVAFITALNVRRHKSALKPVLKRIAKHGDGGSGRGRGGDRDDEEGDTTKKTAADGSLLARTVRKCMDGDGRFESEKMGLVLWERVVNMPPLVLPKMLEALFCEIEWAVEDEPTEQGREDFRMGWFLYVTEVLVGGGVADGAEAEDRSGGTAHKKKKQKTVETPAQPELNFTRAEDEAWFELAADKVDWPISGVEKEKGGVERRGMAMLLAAAKVPAMRKRVEQMVGFVEEEEDSGEQPDKAEKDTDKDMKV